MNSVRTKQHNVPHTRKREDGKVIKAGRGQDRTQESVAPSLRSGAVTQFKKEKVVKKIPNLFTDSINAIGEGVAKGSVTVMALGMAFGTLGFSIGGAVAGSALVSMLAPFALPIMGLMVLSSLADAGDKHLKKLFLTKKDNKTVEQAEETVREWEEMDKEDRKAKVETPYSLKNRIQGGIKSAWREANSWTYFVVGDLMVVPKAKLLGNISKQARLNAKHDKVKDRIRFLENKVSLLEVKGYTNKQVESIKARIRFEQSKL